MKKKLIDILNVLNVFQSLANKRFNDFHVSLKLAKAYKELDFHKKFYIEEEKKIVDEYASRDDNGNVIIEKGNMVKFSSLENRQKFEEDVTKLQETEVDIFDTLELRVSDFKFGDGLTPKEILSLEGFVTFSDNNENEERGVA